MMKSPFRWYKERKKKKRLEEVRKNPYKRVDSDKMTDIEKMDKGFNGKTYSVNGLDVDSKEQDNQK